jgi:hypothetical protein
MDRRTGAPVKVMSWHTAWEQLYAGSEYIQADTAGYVAWLRDLIDRGLLPQPRPYVVERLVRFYEQKLHKTLQKSGGSAETAKLYRDRLGVCLAAQARLAQPRGRPVAPIESEPDLPDPTSRPVAEGDEPAIDDLEPVPPPRKRPVTR